MTVQNATAFVLSVSDGADPESFSVIGAFNTNSFTLNGEPASYITKTSGGWEQLAAGTGSMSIEVSGEGVLTDDQAVKDLLGQKMERTAKRFQITLPALAHVTGDFMITALSIGGAAEETVSLSITLRSASKPDYVSL